MSARRPLTAVNSQPSLPSHLPNKLPVDLNSLKYAEVTNYKGDDPLVPWGSYLNWAQSALTLDSYLPLLHTCITTLSHLPIYHSNTKYIKLWIQYAEKAGQALHVFQVMKSKGIGNKLAVFYQAYALVCEQEGMMDDADQVYMDGLMIQADPLPALLEAYAQFKKRLAAAGLAIPSPAPQALKKRATVDAARPSKHPRFAPHPPAQSAATSIRDYEIAYKPELLLHGGVELQFEEVRAMAMAKKASLEQVQSPGTGLTGDINDRLQSIQSFLHHQTIDKCSPITQAVTGNPSPTVWTRTALEDVEAMFKDGPDSPIDCPLNNPTVTSCFEDRSLTSELPCSVPAKPSPGRHSRPSPVHFNVFQDEEESMPLHSSTRPSSLDDKENVPQSRRPSRGSSSGMNLSSLTFTPSACPSAGSVYQDEALSAGNAPITPFHENMLEMGTDEPQPPPAKCTQRVPLQPRPAVGPTAPLPLPPVPSFSSTPYVMTPILETSHESDSNTSTSGANGNGESVNESGTCATIDPFESEHRAELIKELRVASMPGVTHTPHTPAPFDLLFLLDGTELDVELGDRFLHVESCLNSGSEVGGGKKCVELAVQDIDEGVELCLRITTPSDPWEYYLTQTLLQRLTASSYLAAHRPLFQIASQAFVFENCSCVLSEGAEHGTLQDVLNAYKLSGHPMDDTLVLYYGIELARALAALHELDVVHAGLEPKCVVVRNGESADWGDWQPAQTPAWSCKGLSLTHFHSSIDKQLYPTHIKFQTHHPSSIHAQQPFTDEIDAIGYVNVVHRLMFGTELKISIDASGRMTLTQPYRTPFQRDTWSPLLDRLLNASGPILSLLRTTQQELEGRLMKEVGRAKAVKMLLCKQNIMMLDCKGK